MAKSRLSIVPKKPVVSQAPESLPEPIQRVLYDIQQQLFRINATVASIHALAEMKDCDGDVRWALEGVSALFASLLDDDLSRIITSRLAEREVRHG